MNSLDQIGLECLRRKLGKSKSGKVASSQAARAKKKQTDEVSEKVELYTIDPESETICNHPPIMIYIPSTKLIQELIEIANEFRRRKQLNEFLHNFMKSKTETQPTDKS